MTEAKERSCIVSGTFDPLTVGHRDIIERAAKMFDMVHVLVAKTSSKPGHLMSYEEKVRQLKVDLCTLKNIEIHPIEGALVDQAKALGSKVIVRGLRNEQDLIYEMDMSSVNRMLNSEVETVYLPCKPELSFVSSSMVRELCRLGKWEEASKFTSATALGIIKSKLTKIVAITGGIACGKSQVQKIFEANDWATIDCDNINRAHVLGSRYYSKMINDALFAKGYSDVLNSDGVIDPKKLAVVVFDPKCADAKRIVEKIAWPVILDVVECAKSDWTWNKSNKMAVQVPCLFEEGSEDFTKIFDETVCITSSEQVQIERMVNTRNMTVEEAKARIQAQSPVESKAKKCDFVIENNSDLAVLEANVKEVLEKL